MKTRRKRPVPEGWASAANIATFQPTSQLEPEISDARFLALDKTGDQALMGGAEGNALVVSLSQQRIVQKLPNADAPITCGTWAGSRPTIATDGGKVMFLQDDNSVASLHAHVGKVTSLAIHPSGDILASVGTDKSYVLYDVEASEVLTQVFTDSGMWHIRLYTIFSVANFL